MRLTELPIKAIAVQCGYPNQLYFSQAFKKSYGLSPQEWRKQNCSKTELPVNTVFSPLKKK